MMKAHLKHILLTTDDLKEGYVILHEDLFGIVINNISKSEVEVLFTDETKSIFQKNYIRNRVVKFIAIMKDNKSYPIIHGDFQTIISYINTEEKVKSYIDHQNVKIEGNIKKIYANPKVDDVVHITSMAVLEKHPSMLQDKIERIGIITSISNNICSIKLPGRKLELKKTTFEILNTLDNKYVFELDK